MKYCKKCDKEFDDDLNFCSYCGNQLAIMEEPLKSCPVCGKELDEDMNFCPVCGTVLKAPLSHDEQSNFIESATTDTPTEVMRPPIQGVGTIMCFMVISCIITGIMMFVYAGLNNYAAMFMMGILPLFWKIPMTVHFYSSANNFKKLSTTFKVCTLLFLSGISGLMLLCNKDL